MRATPRVLLVMVLLLAPGLAARPSDAAAGAHDLVVTLAPGARLDPMPEGARAVSLVDAVIVPAASSALEAELRGRAGVLSVEHATPLMATSDPNLQLTRAEPAPATATGVTLTGRGVTVAVVDSGIDATHPDLRDRVKANVKLVNGRFLAAPGDTSGHGTHVAGLVAADGGSSDGKYRGSAPGVDLVGLDISDRFTTASALLAYDWLYANKDQYGIRVVVNAWGRVGSHGEAFDPDDALIRAIDKLVDSGVVVLFSASNHGPGTSTLSLEAEDPRVITVGAVDAAAQLASYSSRGPVLPPPGVAAWTKPDVMAPGDNVVGLRSLESAPDAQADVDALHRIYSGTSQAVPHVAGIVALMLQANPALSPRQVAEHLRASAIDLGAPGPDPQTGFGLVDARDAIALATGRPADRANVLVAGGADRFEDGARLAAAPTQPPARGGGLLGGLGGGAPVPTTVWSTTFPVKSGATALAFELSWSAGAAALPLTVRLARDGVDQGSWDARPDGAGGTLVRGRLDRPAPGIWTLTAQGAQPATVQVRSQVDVLLGANATRALEMDRRFVDAAPPTFVARGTSTRGADGLVGSALDLVADHPLVLPAFAAGLLAAALLATPVRRRARTAPVASQFEV